MNFIEFSLIAVITFIITQFGGTQIIGVLLFKLPKKEYNTLIALIFWCVILVGYYFVINTWFNDYFNVYLWTTIISLIFVILNIKNLKNE